MRWFRTKSHLCRELEVQAIRDFIESEKGDTEQERTKRLADDAGWMAALTAATPAPSSPSSSSSPPSSSSSSLPSSCAPSCPSPECSSEVEPVSRFAAAKARVRDLAARVRAKFAKAAAGGGATERSRRRTAAAAAADGSSV